MFGVFKSGDMSETAYSKNPKKDLQYCQELAGRNIKSAADKTKSLYGKKFKECCLEVGVHVLVRKVNMKGRYKLENKWMQDTNVVLEKPNAFLPVFKVHPVTGKRTVEDPP